MNIHDDDDVTIEDEIDQFPSKSSEKNIGSELSMNYQWISILSVFVLILILILIFKKRFSNSSSKLSNKKDEDQINEYERMIAIREKQQKLYEEQAQRAAQLKQQKLKEAAESKTEEKSKPLRYRSNDHNPLTGQSTSHKSDSCSWRPSSSRRRPQGG